jgi:hypothetical protein
MHFAILSRLTPHFHLTANVFHALFADSAGLFLLDIVLPPLSRRSYTASGITSNVCIVRASYQAPTLKRSVLSLTCYRGSAQNYRTSRDHFMPSALHHLLGCIASAKTFHDRFSILARGLL